MRTGRYEVKGVKPSTSPSMDIQVSSNFERLLFEAYGRNAASVRPLMASLAQSGAFTIEAGPGGPRDPGRIRIRCLRYGRGGQGEIARTLAQTGELLDPHTAVGLGVALKERDYSGP